MFFLKKLLIKIHKNIYFIFVIFGIVFLSSLNKRIIFGKLNFLLLDTFWPFYDLASQLNENHINIKSKIKSDFVTENSVSAAFGLKTKNYWRSSQPMYGLILPLNSFFPTESDELCIINLKGFPDTWVPRLTSHWDPILSNTSRFYEHNGYTGKKLAITIENNFKDKCIVIKDTEVPWEKEEILRYHSPNLNYSVHQQDVHILQFRRELRQSYNIFIDTGRDIHVNEKLLDYLAINEIYKIDEIFITHPHKDHYSGLFELVHFGIPIKKVWMNMPDKKKCNTEIPWGCDYPDLLRLRKLLSQENIELQEVFHTDIKNPKLVYRDQNSMLSILFASPSTLPNLGLVDINDLSIIMKLSTKNKSYLFTGDLNNPLSNVLKGNSVFASNILKVPHHGTEGVASNEFFDTVGAEIGIVPSPEELWCSERSKRVRDYFKVKKTKMFISSYHGNILFRHFENGSIKITTERNPEKICE